MDTLEGLSYHYIPSTSTGTYTYWHSKNISGGLSGRCRVMSSRERAFLRFSVHILECSNVRKRKKREVGL